MKIMTFALTIALTAIGCSAFGGDLHDAIRAGDIERVKVLVAGGGDVNQLDRSLGSPLHQAVLAGNGEIVAILLAKGADPNAKSRVLGTPLSLAARRGFETVCQELISAGADLAERNDDGMTPLHLAAEGGHVGTIELLIASGADVNVRTTPAIDVPDYAPVHSAGLAGHFDVVDLLRAHGAHGPRVEAISNLMSTASVERGAQVYKANCDRCHSVVENEDTLYGPRLWGVVDRKKASEPGFNYSPAFLRLVGLWTVPELNAYLASPSDYVPGTRMGIEGATVPDAADRADLIAFLRTNGEPN
jgi:cytochrome c2